MRIVILLLLMFISFTLNAQDIQVSVFTGETINSATVSIQSGRYQLKADGTVYGEYKRDIFLINRHGGIMDLRDKRNFIGNFKEIRIIPLDDNGILTVKPSGEKTKSKEYCDEINLRIADENIQLINKVDLEKYIAGVVEAECGAKATFEFYKAQALLIRTYTIKNMFKHGEEGFNLCDQVHCQVYNGRSRFNDEIYRATKATAGIVLTDKDSTLLLTPYFSNCGGQTSSSGMVWQKDLPHLQSVKDPFCNTGKNYNWNATLTMATWEKFLREKKVPEALIKETTFNYQATERKKYIEIGKVSISLREIRERFKLPSTFFSFTEEGDKIVFTGHGYGHGAGMCQQGAMEMSRVGYTYLDIIHFYFQDVYLVDYREMEIDRY